MLTITPQAGLAIKRLTQAEGAEAEGGLRIDTLATDQTPSYTLSIAPIPDETDHIVREETTGSRVLLDSLTAEQVADMVLDVDDTVEGSPQFRLKPSTP